MKTLFEQNFINNSENFGPDPLLCRKKGLKVSISQDILDYKRKIEDPDYMDHAIDRIALELMHFIMK